MTLSDISKQRLINQQIIGSTFNSAEAVVGFLGAVQAQDYAMAKWAVGVRLPGSTDHAIEQAINDGDIIRTHVLRPTWHLVSKSDLRWMLKLTAPRIMSASASMFKKLELDDKLFKRCNIIIEKSLKGNHHLTRAELMEVLEKSGIRTNDLRGIHILFRAELDGLVCNGVRRARQHTYALLDERVTPMKNFNQDEALAMLATRYFTSHGPATLRDFTWWSGLGVSDAKQGLEMIRSTLLMENIASDTYYFFSSMALEKNKTRTIHFLPAYDEFMVSYKNRTAALAAEFAQLAISGNGIFNPVIVANGKVVGIWKRSIIKNRLVIKPVLFSQALVLSKQSLVESIKKLEQFFEMKVEIIFP